ncbi:uncharacterized protein LOC124421438 [Lucilia cuprina]|uniref:uncharacterized protein LOC124421438 n=1 Tax=Lucilia cuprina TaxID=7375 RepID=UPI001F06D031|nr:uncharacterized protein LOC124421438 [Lucilia cuprina]
MKTQKNIFFLLVTVLIIQLVQCTCNNNYYNEFVSKLRLKRDSTIEQNFHSNMSLHRNLHYLPENAIYCTEPINSDTGRYGFLRKYYSAIQGKPVSYDYTLECIYPKSLELPSSREKKPLTGVEKFTGVLLTEAKNFKELLEKVERGEKTEPYKTIDIDFLADDIFNDILNEINNPKQDPLDNLEGSAPYGVICEHLIFNETNEQGIVVDIKRPICYPASRSSLPTTTTSPTMTKYPTVTTVTKSSDSKFVDKACHILCYTGLIYQLLSCCK